MNSKQADYDLCVIGGGINGAGIARDAAGRGLSVLLVEAQDLASATSSASTKLVHGGLRYLEHYEFRLVRDALKERDVLLHAAPHIIWPMEFILPHNDSLRPAWLIRLGLFLYDRLGGSHAIKKSNQIELSTSQNNPLKDDYRVGFSYGDCWAEDSRLVVLNAMDAAERGADILTRTACVSMNPVDERDAWLCHLQNTDTGDQLAVTAKMVVNAAGPWVRSFLDGVEMCNRHTPGVRLVKGSHIVVSKLYDGPEAYILQQQDKRIVFAIPYEKHYTLIGTTDEETDGSSASQIISQNEIDYLLKAINDSFHYHVTPQDIVWTYSGVRALVDDGEQNSSEVTRDYKLILNDENGPPLLSVFGGKITTYRKLAEQAVDKLSFYATQQGDVWTSSVPLPGGDIPEANFDLFVEQQKVLYPWLPENLLYRYCRAYGTRLPVLLNDAQSIEMLGYDFGGDVYEAEIRYLIRYEFAREAEDIFWRRSKLGLHVYQEVIDGVTQAMPIFLKEELYNVRS